MATQAPNEAPFQTFDELIRRRALDDDQTPLIAYPKTHLGIDDYELFNGKTLNRLVDGASKFLISIGLLPVYEPTVVGLYGISDLSYATTLFALARLGYTGFLLSPRLPVNAVVALLTTSESRHLLYAPQFNKLATQTAGEIPLRIIPLPVRSDYDHPNDTTPEFARENVDNKKENQRKFMMMHSSGSTGLPRPIDYTHKRLFVTVLASMNAKAFQSVPLFHAYGFVTLVQAIWDRKTVYMFNGNVPQTHDTVTAAINAAQPEIVWTVPYVLGLLAEKPAGMETLKKCKVVSSGGSRCPDELGDLLVANGIHFGTGFGATEVALILTSMNRPREDKAWNYLRPLPHAAPYLRFYPLDEKSDICECVVLDGHRGKVMSNSDDPPNSYHTKDLFIAHPTVPNAWKFVGRLDDRVTLTNGEKVLPLSMEGRVRQHPLVKEAVVFGVDRPVPGLLLFRAESALSDADFINQVWGVVEEANNLAEAFSQISREMIVVIPVEVDCPSTDKSSIKRAQVYREFASVINSAYTTLESSAEGTLKLSLEELEVWIMTTFQSIGIVLENSQTDFFGAGVDSLKAIQMRGLIVRNIDLGGNVQKCGSLIVYDCGNAEKLAETLNAIAAGEMVKLSSESDIEMMEAMIEKYSVFEKHVPVPATPGRPYVVLLTGATGSLGSHLLAQLIANPQITKIYCPIRTHQRTHPNRVSHTERLEQSLLSRNFPPEIASSEKLTALFIDLSKPSLNMPPFLLTLLTRSITHIFHCAWEVNFALPLSSFEPQILHLHTLIELSRMCGAKFFFCSSVGAAMGAPPNPSQPVTTIPSASLPKLASASPTGYARSKLISERILENAVKVAGADATIFRIGQIIPSPSSGSQLWNPNEMIPLMVRSALTLGVLPDRPGGSAGDGLSWLDVDTLAKVMTDLGFSEGDGQLVYNLVHPRPCSWRQGFLPALRAAELSFEVVEWEEWLEKLAKSDIANNPSRKLLTFWESAARGKASGGELRFNTGAAEARSETLRNAGAMVDDRTVKNMVEAWKEVWSGNGGTVAEETTPTADNVL